MLHKKFSEEKPKKCLSLASTVGIANSFSNFLRSLSNNEIKGNV